MKDHTTLNAGMSKRTERPAARERRTAARGRAGWKPATALTAILLVAVGCASMGAPRTESLAEAETLPQAGAAIWSATCNRCHNERPGTQFTAEEWPVLVRHMRTRAHLTRREAEAVTAFLVELAELR